MKGEREFNHGGKANKRLRELLAQAKGISTNLQKKAKIPEPFNGAQLREDDEK